MTPQTTPEAHDNKRTLVLILTAVSCLTWAATLITTVYAHIRPDDEVAVQDLINIAVSGLAALASTVVATIVCGLDVLQQAVRAHAGHAETVRSTLLAESHVIRQASAADAHAMRTEIGRELAALRECLLSHPDDESGRRRIYRQGYDDSSAGHRTIEMAALQTLGIVEAPEPVERKAAVNGRLKSV